MTRGSRSPAGAPRLEYGPVRGRLGGLKNVGGSTRDKRTAHANGWHPEACAHCAEERPLRTHYTVAGDEELRLCPTCSSHMKSEVVP